MKIIRLFVLALMLSVAASLSAQLAFHALPPCRVADTRNSNDPLGGPWLAAGQPRDFPILQSACLIPSTAAAYSLNLTVVPHGYLGYLSLWPTGLSQPLVSTLNSYDGSVVANAAIVTAGSNGEVTVFATNDTDLVIDVDGYFDNSDSQGPTGPQGPQGLTGPQGPPGLGGPATIAVPYTFNSASSASFSHNLGTTNPLYSCLRTSGSGTWTVSPQDSNNVTVTALAPMGLVCSFAYVAPVSAPPPPPPSQPIYGGPGQPGANATVTVSKTTVVLGTGDVLAQLQTTPETVGQSWAFSLNNEVVYLLLFGGSHKFIDANTGFAFVFNSPITASINGTTMYLYQSTNALFGNWRPQITS